MLIHRLLAGFKDGLCMLAAAGTLLPLGCSNVEKATPKPKPERADRSFQIEVPPIMRGTVAAEAVLLGYEPTIVHGYGLVVGLKGTGASDIPPDVRAYMVATAARQGIGSEREGFGHISPEALLNSHDTAVVIVEGMIPPGAPEGTNFDIRVYAHPASSTTSLEGGRLYTAELSPVVRPDRASRMLPPTGMRQSAPLAVAGGPVFINPFAEPGAVGRDSITRTSGRVLNGGVVKKDMTLKLRLANPSHGRAMILQSAINTRFPQEPGQHDQTARGESDETIEITVPPSFREKTGEFVELLRHTSMRQIGADAVALSVRRYLQENPDNARQASWRWQSIGPRSLPIIKDLYDYSEELPRLAALRAGAKLDDPLVIPSIIGMARVGSSANRVEAIELLADMPMVPQIDLALRELLDDDDVDVRLTAYEALAKRGDAALVRFNVDGQFSIDLVDSSKPLIYVTQIGQPRLVVFGPDLSVERPITVAAWSNRLLVKGDSDQKQIEVYYREPDADQGIISKVEPSILRIAAYLGHRTTVDHPEPGLGLSYAETVGAIHQIWRQGFIRADFKAEQDRILAAIMSQRNTIDVRDRPEFDEPEPETPVDAPEQAQGPAPTALERLAPMTLGGEQPVPRPRAGGPGNHEP